MHFRFRTLSSTGNGLTHDVIDVDDSEEEVTEQHLASEYMNEKDAIVSCAAKLIAHDMVPKV